IDHQAEVHRRRGIALPHREVIERLLLAVLDDLEIVLRQVGDEIAFLVRDGCGKGREVDAASEGDLRPGRAGERKRDQREKESLRLLRPWHEVLRHLRAILQRYNLWIVRCLAVCHTELVIRLLEAVLTPSAGP